MRCFIVVVDLGFDCAGFTIASIVPLLSCVLIHLGSFALGRLLAWPLAFASCLLLPSSRWRLDVLLLQPLVHVIFCQCPILVTVNDGHLRVNRTRTRLCLCHFVLLVFWACLPQEDVCTPSSAANFQMRYFHHRHVVDHLHFPFHCSPFCLFLGFLLIRDSLQNRLRDSCGLSVGALYSQELNRP